MKILVIGDTHITEASIPELTRIFIEINQFEADKVILLGDYYDKNKPTPLELKFGTRIAKGLVDKYKDVTILTGTGNHDMLHDYSVVEYLAEVGVKISRGNYIYNNMLFGHFMLHESKLEYGSGKCGVKDLKQYDVVFLGHQHSEQSFPPHPIFHLGSVRYVNFNEVKDEGKFIAIIEDKNWQFKKLESPIPMKDFASIEEVSKQKIKTIKARLVISSYEQFKKEINNIAKWKNKFVEFKVKLDFHNNAPQKELQTSTIKRKKLQDILNEGIKKIKDKDVQALLMEVME